jgi:hypothetical protein
MAVFYKIVKLVKNGVLMIIHIYAAYAKAQADAYAKGYADGKNGYYNGESSTAK